MVYGLVQFSRSHSTAHVSVLEHGMEKSLMLKNTKTVHKPCAVLWCQILRFCPGKLRLVNDF